MESKQKSTRARSLRISAANDVMPGLVISMNLFLYDSITPQIDLPVLKPDFRKLILPVLKPNFVSTYMVYEYDNNSLGKEDIYTKMVFQLFEIINSLCFLNLSINLFE